MGRQGLVRLRAVAGDTGWAAFSEGAQLASSLGTFYLLATRLGPAEYGFFVGVQSLVAVLTMLSSGWISLLLLQEAVRERRPASEVFPACLTSALVLAPLVLLVALGLGSWLLAGLPPSTIALFALAELLGTGGVLLSAALLQATVGYPPSARLRGSYVLGRLALVVALVLLVDLSLRTVAITYAAYGLTCGAAATLLVARRLDVRLVPRLPTWPQLRSGLGYAGTSLMFGVQEDADKSLLVRLADASTAGLYGAAYRSVQLGIMPVRAVLSATHQRFLVDDGRPGEHRQRSLHFTGLALGYAVPAALLLVLAAPLLPRVLGEEYAGSTDLVRLLAPLVALRAASLFAFNGLLGLRQNGRRVVVLALSSVTTLAALFALVPRYGAEGAAGATLLAEVVFLVSTWTVLLRAQRRADREPAPHVPVRAA